MSTRHGIEHHRLRLISFLQRMALRSSQTKYIQRSRLERKTLILVKQVHPQHPMLPNPMPSCRSGHITSIDPEPSSVRLARRLRRTKRVLHRRVARCARNRSVRGERAAPIVTGLKRAGFLLSVATVMRRASCAKTSPSGCDFGQLLWPSRSSGPGDC